MNINIEKIKENISSFTSEKLCEMIVSNRYLTIDKQIDGICMKELSHRRINGDQFDFEGYIKEIGKDLPDLKVNLPNIKHMVSSMINIKDYLPKSNGSQNKSINQEFNFDFEDFINQAKNED